MTSQYKDLPGSLLALVKNELGIETLETVRNSSDFFEVAVWQIRDVVVMAYEAGKRANNKTEDQ